MATITITRGTTLPDEGVKTDLHNLIDTATATITNIVNADVNSSAAIAGTKISPNFGGQDITTTGDISGDNLTLTTDATITGDVDIDGTLETDAITLNGAAINAASGIVTLTSGSIVKGKRCGTIVSKSLNTAYEAEADGMIFIWKDDTDDKVWILSDANATPTTDRGGNRGAYSQACWLVPKGQYYIAKSEASYPANAAYWIPLGD